MAGNAQWAEPSPLFANRARPAPLKCENEYLVLPLGEETAVQAVVGSIVWAFRRLKKPRSREMSARGYALHSVCPRLSFFLQLSTFLFPFPPTFLSSTMFGSSCSGGAKLAQCGNTGATQRPKAGQYRRLVCDGQSIIVD